MPEDNNNDEKKFTQEDVNRLLADQKRTVTEKLTDRYSDYDDLKATAGRVSDLEQALEEARTGRTTAEEQVAKYQAKEQVADWAKEITKDSEIPAHVLRGSTREELEAHFADLQALTPQKKRTPVPAGTPAGGAGGGSRAAAALRELRGAN
ncbi:hypothetical protein [Agromyces sp. SYSU T00194]|uniref:hypothetical protein n=1 Tax=Agromyces chitinivorans TaxID=3158560 RepID=UPI0033968FF6